ncbi:MAG: hypothetical protein OEQ74_01310 [Gammaproteobacteria bacterium]|nr:hypothetical protein [Gammaproteobacteria bacterium]
MAAQTPSYSGGCHCGGVRYVFSTDSAPAQWPVRRCTCSFCIRLGARYTSGPGARLEVTVQHASMAASYEFGTQTAEFFRCNRCGVMLFATCKLDNQRFAVININTLDDVEQLSLNTVDVDFNGEHVENRLERRRRNWIGDVSVRYVNA